MLRRPNLIVVGAGVAGLTAAGILAREHPVTVIDRLPLVGGVVAGRDHALVRELARQCDDRSVGFILGATALRWSSDRGLLVAGPTQGIVSLPTFHLAFAGGMRPSTLTELRVTGDRLAGITPATAAYHLLDAGVRLGHRVVVIGAGTWAHRVGHLIRKQASRVTVVDPTIQPTPPEFADRWWPGWSPIEVRGSSRVSELVVAKEGQEERIDCDAVILAARMKPVRNVDGAVLEDDDCDAVTFIQPIAESASTQEINEHAAGVAIELLEKLDGRAA